MSTPHTQTFSAFIILESRHSNWQDQYFTHYQYSSRIPNGQQIKVGDLLLIAKTKKELKTDKQIYTFCTVKNIYTEQDFFNYRILRADFNKVHILNDSYKYTNFIKSSGISRNSIKKIPEKDLVQTLKTLLNDISN